MINKHCEEKKVGEGDCPEKYFRVALVIEQVYGGALEVDLFPDPANLSDSWREFVNPLRMAVAVSFQIAVEPAFLNVSKL